METLGSLKGDFVLDGGLFPRQPISRSRCDRDPRFLVAYGGEDAPTLPIDSEIRELIFLRGILVITDLTPERELSTRAR